jgi:threonine/homoserine/homoserine lactone efflux protein
MAATRCLFTVASLVLIVTPGQDMVLAMSRSVAQGTRSHLRRFRDGALSNLTNPKIAIFYFAFLPQFVAPNAKQPTLTVFTLGLAFAALTFLVKAPAGLVAFERRG